MATDTRSRCPHGVLITDVCTDCDLDAYGHDMSRAQAVRDPPLTQHEIEIRNAYHDIGYPARQCHRESCGKDYQGPTVYCSFECATKDA